MMRLWVSRNSPVSLREQLATQIMLGVVGEDLKRGERLPSVRELGRRYRIHSNTVSAAYRDLAARGWLEMRKGSGVFVADLRPAAPAKELDLDERIAHLLQEAKAAGFTWRDVCSRVEHLSQAHAKPERLIVFEPEPELCDILIAEIAEATRIPVSRVTRGQALTGSVFAALASRAKQLRAIAPASHPTVLLRLRSVADSLQGQKRPAPSDLVTVVSHSPEILRTTRTVLLAAGVDEDALEFRDAREPGWDKGLRLSALVISDVVTGRKVPADCVLRIFRVVADSSIGQLCGA